ncbi:hypothetical protein Bpfe_008254, partial [Biomphalaria pfeifferi]
MACWETLQNAKSNDLTVETGLMTISWFSQERIHLPFLVILRTETSEASETSD